jgi:predicted dehydrogenase
VSPEPLGVGLTGTGWVSDVHARALRRTPGAKLCGVVSRDRSRGEAFAARHGIPRVHGDHRALLEDRELDVICVGLPNDQHERVVLDAARAKKHVICEKPLATSLEEGERMVAACREAGVMLALGVELCFIPKFVRCREIVASGALGRIYQVHQREQHGGPHSPWFYTREQAGGGILMDMGCHSIEVTRYVLDYPKPLAVYARMSNELHPTSELEDHCTLLLELDGGVVALLEPSWALPGGMESHLDLFGTEGVLYADLLRGTGMRMYSERGLPEDPLGSQRWSIQDPDWLWSNGYPQEMEHFLECARSGARPRVSGEDGLVQLEISYAAYESAATGRRVELPFRPRGCERAVDLWLAGKHSRARDTR